MLFSFDNYQLSIIRSVKIQVGFKPWNGQMGLKYEYISWRVVIFDLRRRLRLFHLSQRVVTFQILEGLKLFTK